MRRIVSLLILFILPSFFTLTGNRICGGPTAPAVNAPARSTLCSSLYHDMQLDGVVNWEAFRQAVTGYYKISGRKKNILTLLKTVDIRSPKTVISVHFSYSLPMAMQIY